jgi:hypothetical protein
LENILKSWSQPSTEQKEWVDVMDVSNFSHGADDIDKNMMSGSLEDLKVNRYPGITANNILCSWSNPKVAAEETKTSSAIFGLGHQRKMPYSIPDNLSTSKSSSDPDLIVPSMSSVPCEKFETSNTSTPSFCSVNGSVDQDFIISSTSTLITEYAKTNPKDLLSLLYQPSSHTEFVIRNYCFAQEERFGGGYPGKFAVIIILIIIIYFIIIITIRDR